MTVSSIFIFLYVSFVLVAVDSIKDKEDYLKQLIKQYQNIQRFFTDIQIIDSNLKINVELIKN